MKKYTADMTENKTIFRDTYWGNFEYDKERYDTIVDNRNLFVTECNLKKLAKLRKPLNGSTTANQPTMWDHSEVYETHDGGVVIIASPYGKPAAEEGFRECQPLYSKQATTYIRHFISKKEYRKWLPRE